MAKRQLSIQEKIKIMYEDENLTDTQVEMMLDELVEFFMIGTKIVYRELYQNAGK